MKWLLYNVHNFGVRDNCKTPVITFSLNNKVQLHLKLIYGFSYLKSKTQVTLKTPLLPSHCQLLLHLLKGILISFFFTNIAKIALVLTSSLFELPNQVTGVDHSHNGIFRTNMNSLQ